MKITAIHAVYPNYHQPLSGWRPYLWQIVVRVETEADDGAGAGAYLRSGTGHFTQFLQLALRDRNQ